MSLAAGSTIAHYEILSPLGKGGMGEVYRARDSRLKRDVALKIIPDVFASDPERLARFQREAELLASLNHPNIASIYGIEEDKGRQALVLEVVDGETLAERLRRGPLPVEEAVQVAKQIAHALESAHERGVIHRDLKPANVMLTPDGKTKVLDFGLATICLAASSADLSNSPTMFTASGGGVLMGTAAYMSPEQARGKTIDRRSDVWAFGCVLYEMLTGRQLFGGETASDSIAKVLEREPDWSELQKFPTPVQVLLRRCLQKNPARRLRDLGVVVMDLEDFVAGDMTAGSSAPSAVARYLWPLTTAALLVISVILGTLYLTSRPSAVEPVYLSIVPPDGQTFGAGAAGVPALSPDGRSIAFTAVDGPDAGQLWIRSLFAADARAVEGSEGAAAPFWSPDSRWVGFFANGKLYRADSHGGKPQMIASLESTNLSRASATWNRDGTILFGLDTGRPLSKVAAEGGRAAPATELGARQDAGHFRPQFLPDGRHFLFLVQAKTLSETGIYVGSLDSKEIASVLPGIMTTAYYVPSGHLVFVRNSTLFAQDFDLDRLAVRGEAIRIADSVFFDSSNAALATFSVSDKGILAYRTGDSGQARQAQLAWFDRRGTRLENVGRGGLIHNPRLSPDGSRVAVQVEAESAPTSIWVFGPGATSSRIVSQGFSPVWTADGSRLVYARPVDGTGRLLSKRITVEGAEEETLGAGAGDHIDDVSPDSKYAVVSRNTGATNRDIIAVPLAPDQKPVPVADSAANELFGRVSPDGHWIAYQSDESGRPEIYLQAFPRAGSKTLVSQGGGQWPVWLRDGKELFYISPEPRKLMSVAISGNVTIATGKPEALFSINITRNFGIGTPSHFDVSADGKRFLIATASREATRISVIHLVLNWTELLKR